MLSHEAVVFAGATSTNVGATISFTVIALEVYSLFGSASVTLSGSKPNSSGVTSGAVVTVICGNHDRPGDESTTSHAMLAHDQQRNVHVVDRPQLLTWITPKAAAIPYMASNERFLEAAAAVGGSTLLAHQTFQGAKYDNGFFCPDGIPVDGIPHDLVISGHIHAPQSFGKVWYVGAPRWRTLDDANTDRNLWLVDLDDPKHCQSFSTVGICWEIRHIVLTPSEADVPTFDPPLIGGELHPGIEWRLDIKGPAAFVDKWKSAFSASNVKIRTFITDTASTVKVRESQGIGKAFESFKDSYTPRYGTPKETLDKLVASRVTSWT